MTGSRTRPAIIVAGLLLGLLAVTLQGVQGEGLENVPSEDQCRPYIEKALKDLGTEGSPEHESAEETEAANDGSDEGPGEDPAADTNDDDEQSGSREKREVSGEEQEEVAGDDDEKGDGSENNEVEQDQVDTIEITSVEEADGGDESTADDNADDDGDGDADADGDAEGDAEGEAATDSNEDKSKEAEGDESAEKQDDGEQEADTEEGNASEENKSTDEEEGEVAVAEDESGEKKDEEGADDASNEKDDDPADNVESDEQKTEELEQSQEQEEEAAEDGDKSAEEEAAAADDDGDSQEKAESAEEAEDQKEDDKSEEKEEEKSEEKGDDDGSKEDGDDKKSVEEEEVVAEKAESLEQEAADDASGESKAAEEDGKSDEEQKEGDAESKENEEAKSDEADGEEGEQEGEDKEGDASEEGDESRPEEEELIMEIEIPEILRPRDHINQLLKLDEENEEKEKAVEQVADIVLRDLKRLYDNAIKPLETLYKYRDLSNRHFGDPEIFSKPLVLFMGPWSGGKSSIINYLLDIEYKPTSLRTGAEPSPAYFNILMHGEEEEVLDGTQLAADWTFSGLQKFGQGLLDRLKGVKLNNKLLEKVNIVEIPGILEIRKQVQRLFPFNDACQWFIDRADIIFLVYDPSKLDVGPETEAILDQLKGREYQSRIILNKADQVKPEELMRVQGALIWNISPLMSSAEPPVMYSTSLWSIPYEAGAPTRLLYAQERAFLRDLRSAIDKRVEHKIASARRFAVRVRNHAKMVDCYLTTYYNHKSFFAKKKDISDRIIENPQDYHIYEGLSTLTNISRYDLPDPDVYRDFFRLNPLYDFPLLSSTCTYFRGCPINRLDVAIAYDLPELVGKYKKSVEAVLHQQEAAEATAAPASAPAPQAQQAADQQKRAVRSGASRITMS